jgi:aspartate/methionine/tyrosine aminotransferase
VPLKPADRTLSFTESVIREMTRRIALYHPDDGINLAQGFPDFAAPSVLKEAAAEAIASDINQYAITWGSKDFREGIAEKTHRFLGIDVDAETEVTVTCGATEAMISSMLAIVNPGDEVVIFEPFYENYGPDCILSGASPSFVPLIPPDWSVDKDRLAAAFGPKTRAIVVNTPNNPTGKVFSRDELSLIADLCNRWDCIAMTDEIYEHMVYDGLDHISLATLPGMRERTITVSGLSKTFSVTGWRVGYVIAPPGITDAIRKVHDFLTVGAPAPLQAAGAVAMELGESYYDELRRSYEERRDFIVGMLSSCNFRPFTPHGAYYVMCDVAGFGFESDVSFTQFLVEDVGVAVVPGSSFYSTPGFGVQQVRIAFPKRLETLERVGPLLASIPERAAARTMQTGRTAG